MRKKYLLALLVFLFFFAQDYSIGFLDNLIDFITQTKWMRKDPVIGSVGLLGYHIIALVFGVYCLAQIIYCLYIKKFNNLVFHCALLLCMILGIFIGVLFYDII